MNYTEIHGDLFAAVGTQPYPLMLAHCISSDANMGAGIAKEFRHRYRNMSRWLDCQAYQRPLPIGKVRIWKETPVLTIGNLVTKAKYYQKPSYAALQASLESLIPVIKAGNIKTLAIPAIGSGLDNLKWPHVKSMLYKVFKDVDIDIVVYLL